MIKKVTIVLVGICMILNIQANSEGLDSKIPDLERIAQQKEQQATKTAQEVIENKNSTLEKNKCTQEGATAKYDALKKKDKKRFIELVKKDRNLDCDVTKAVKENDLAAAQEITFLKEFESASIENYISEHAQRISPMVKNVLWFVGGGTFVGCMWLFKAYYTINPRK